MMWNHFQFKLFPQPTLGLDAQYTGATPTFNIEELCLVTNVQQLECLLQ